MVKGVYAAGQRWGSTRSMKRGVAVVADSGGGERGLCSGVETGLHEISTRSIGHARKHRSPSWISPQERAWESHRRARATVFFDGQLGVECPPSTRRRRRAETL